MVGGMQAAVQLLPNPSSRSTASTGTLHKAAPCHSGPPGVTEGGTGTHCVSHMDEQGKDYKEFKETAIRTGFYPNEAVKSERKETNCESTQEGT